LGRPSLSPILVKMQTPCYLKPYLREAALFGSMRSDTCSELVTDCCAATKSFAKEWKRSRGLFTEETGLKDFSVDDLVPALESLLNKYQSACSQRAPLLPLLRETLGRGTTVGHQLLQLSRFELELPFGLWPDLGSRPAREPSIPRVPVVSDETSTLGSVCSQSRNDSKRLLCGSFATALSQSVPIQSVTLEAMKSSHGHKEK
jgi:hypothetical protein